ncbi:MAG TPA: DUF6588 family protein [Longimicrobiales bacterium]|nr:DUF6588 family protein [Longimicrobiales bacterium]
MRAASATVLALAVAAALVPRAAVAQEDDDVLERLRAFAQDNGTLYIEPITSGLGLALTQGTLFTARPQGLYHFDVGVAISGSIVPDEKDTFRPVLPTSITFDGQTILNPYGASANAPLTATATGAEEGGVSIPLTPEAAQTVSANGGDPNDFTLEFLGGLEIPAIPFAVLQASAGLPLGTEIWIRMIPEIEIAEEVGTLSAFGFGIKHSLSQYIPGSPVDFAVTFDRQGVKVGEYLDGSGTSFGVAASRSLGPLTVFAAGTQQTGSVDVRYTFDSDVPGVPGESVFFENDIESTVRLTGGVTLSLLWLKLSGAYSVADYDGFALKVLLSLP